MQPIFPPSYFNLMLFVHFNNNFGKFLGIEIFKCLFILTEGMYTLDERLQIQPASHFNSLGEQTGSHDHTMQVLLIPVKVIVQIHF